MRVEVLRLGHRPGRDPRISTHLALVARAFGAEKLHLQPPDPEMAERVSDVVERFGGTFTVSEIREWKPFVRGWRGTSLHLTMYGEDLDEVIPTVSRTEPVLIIVGGPKVPPEVYQMVTWNVAVTHQPHSEVAALALTLDRLLGTPRSERLPGARMQVLPRRKGKYIVELDGAR